MAGLDRHRRSHLVRGRPCHPRPCGRGPPLGLGDEAVHRVRAADRRGGGRPRPRRARRAGGLDRQAPARARLGPAVRGRHPDCPPGRATHLLERRVRPARRATRRQGRDALRGIPPGGGARSTRPRRHRAARATVRGPARPARRPGPVRPRATCADSPRGGDPRRGDRGRLPGPRRRASRPGHARSRTTGASGSSSRTRSGRTGPAPATHRARSATSAARGRSSGSTRTPRSRAPASRTASSTTGPWRSGRRSRMRCSPSSAASRRRRRRARRSPRRRSPRPPESTPAQARTAGLPDAARHRRR